MKKKYLNPELSIMCFGTLDVMSVSGMGDNLGFASESWESMFDFNGN